MYRFVLFLYFIFSVGFSSAQKIKVVESNDMVEGLSRTGMHVLLELDKAQVEKAWLRYLKQYGKVSSKSGVISMLVADMKAISDYPCKVSSKVEVAHTGAKVWWAIDLGSKYVSAETAAAYKGAEKMLYEFAFSAYRDDIAIQLVDAEKAVESATKIHIRAVKNSQTISSRLEKNSVAKIDFETKLSKNIEDYKRLQGEFDHSLAEQKIALQNLEAVQQRQKLLEGQPQTQEEKKSLAGALNVQKKKVQEGKRLASSLEKNKKAKQILDTRLIKNTSDYAALKKAQEQNVNDTALAAYDVEKMKRAMEVVKDKMTKIE